MYCPNCGSQVNGGKFCPNCGAPIPAGSPGQVNGMNGGNGVRSQSRKKLPIVLIICGIVVLAAVAIFVGTRFKSAAARTSFEFCGYEFSIPESWSYDEENSNDEYAVFHEDEEDSEGRIDFIYAGEGYSEDEWEPDGFIESLYILYQTPSNMQMGVTTAEEVSPIAGMYTIHGQIMMPGEQGGLWDVYACVNDDSELFYFILMDDSKEEQETFEDVLYDTVE